VLITHPKSPIDCLKDQEAEVKTKHFTDAMCPEESNRSLKKTTPDANHKDNECYIGKDLAEVDVA
jgi:hypothetical protein